MDILIGFLNLVIEGLGVVLSWIFGLFPDSPTKSWTNEMPDIDLGTLTWVIPFPTMIVHAAALLTAISVYYIYRILGRWIKVIRS